MTAAITNLFPGSPAVAGENIMVQETASGESDFANLLGVTETTAVQPKEEFTGAEPSSPLQELFTFLNILWGNGTTENDSLSMMPESQTNSLDTGDAGLPSIENASGNSVNANGWSNGFVSELQIILSMFQYIAGNFQASDKGINTSTSKDFTVVPMESALPENPLNNTTASGYMALGNPQTQATSLPTVAPGINLSGQNLPEITDEPAEVWQQNTNERPGAPFSDYYSLDTKATASDKPLLVSSASSPERVPDESNLGAGRAKASDANNLDMHFMTITYSKDKGIDIADLRYSGPLSEELGTEMAKIKDSSFISRPQYTQNETIRMAKASFKANTASLDMQTVHISPELLQDRLSTSPSDPASGINPTSIGNSAGDETLTIDFNDNLADNSDGDSQIDQQAGNGRNITPSSITAAYKGVDDSGNIIDSYSDDLVTSQVKEGINQALKMNKNRAVLHLNPPELGSVKVNITVSHNNQVQASFVADHPETRHILETNMQQLKDSLAQNGFSMAHVNVDVSGGFSQWAGAQQEKLTPFGYPTEYLNTDRDNDSIDTEISRTTGIRPDGVHVIA